MVMIGKNATKRIREAQSNVAKNASKRNTQKASSKNAYKKNKK